MTYTILPLHIPYIKEVTNIKTSMLNHLLLHQYLLLVFTSHTSESDLIVGGVLIETKTRPPNGTVLQVSWTPEKLHPYSKTPDPRRALQIQTQWAETHFLRTSSVPIGLTF